MSFTRANIWSQCEPGLANPAVFQLQCILHTFTFASTHVFPHSYEISRYRLHVKVIISKIVISFSLAAPIAINSNCRCVFGPHGIKLSRSLFSNQMTNKQAICNSCPRDTSPREREPHLSLPSVPFLLSMLSTLGIQCRWKLLADGHFAFLTVSLLLNVKFVSFSSDLLVLEVLLSVVIDLFFVCSTRVTETGKISTPLHTQVSCGFCRHRYPILQMQGLSSVGFRLSHYCVTSFSDRQRLNRHLFKWKSLRLEF